MYPSNLDWIARSDRGRQWLSDLPRMVETMANQWDLDIGEPFQDSFVSLVLPAHRGGSDVVLKIQYPHRESAPEAEALRLWNGNGAVRLLEHDVARCALLLERCLPGHPLSAKSPCAGMNVMIDLLPHLWVEAPASIPSLSDEVARWIINLPVAFEAAGAPFEHSLLNQTIETLIDLASSQGEQVLVNQDLHGDNVLSASRKPWLLIDPKPLRGEREFGLSPVIRSAELGSSRNDVVSRLDRLAEELGLDRERARMWAFGHAIAWGFHDGEVLPSHIEMARWLLDA
ncbi:MAG: aminoglycoside phosphotransferase [bacterium]|nr:aminoglycoside phosphotransferase [bacterium]